MDNVETLQDRLRNELQEDNFKFKQDMKVISDDGNKWYVHDYAINHRYKVYLLVNGQNPRKCSTAWRGKEVLEDEFTRGNEAFERLGW